MKILPTGFDAALYQKLAEKREVESIQKSNLKPPIEIELSDNLRLMQRASTIATAVPDNNQSKVAALKQAVQDGTYKVNAEKVAEKILTEHLDIMWF